MKDDINETLVGVAWVNGVLMQEIERDGEIVHEPIPDKGEDPFKDTDTQPAPWKQVTASGCEEPASKRLSHKEHEEVAIKVRALMLKVMSPRTSGPHTDSIQTNSPVARAILKELCMILDEPEWAERIK